MGPVTIRHADIVESVRAALQHIAVYHSADYLDHLAAAYGREESVAAKAAMGQILESSRLAAIGKRPMCQDTGLVTVFARVGQQVVIASDHGLDEIINEGVRLAYLDAGNPLRASMVADPIFDRKNTGDNTPAITHVEVGPGRTLELLVAAKGGGSENKAKYTMLNPSADLVDWVVKTVEGMGAGWCPPGVIGIGVGGSAEKAMLLAKRVVMEKIDMSDLLRRGPANTLEELRLTLYDRINGLGIGAQGLGGLTTVVDVKIATYPTHAASKPVGLMPQCAANRHGTVVLDGSGPAYLAPPNLAAWPKVEGAGPRDGMRRVNVDTLTREEMADWAPGETLLLSGKILTGRDAAHKRMADLLARGEPLPVPLAGRMIYYVGPVDPVGDEVVGPAGPTTSTRMDQFTGAMLGEGLLSMIGKAERGPDTVNEIAKHGATYLIAVGGAAVLVAHAIRSAKILAFEDLGMEAIREFVVEDMPVSVAVDTKGASIHTLGPEAWRGRHLSVVKRSGRRLV
ncbi:MAG: fumarate hydratase [Pseudomonadota bacterium]